MKRQLALGLVVLLLGSRCAGPQQPKVAISVAVSVVGSAVKVRPTENPSGSQGAQLIAAKNEFESFQVVVRADGDTLTNLRVAPPAGSGLAGSEGEIPKDNITIYREDYYDVKQPSDGEPPGPDSPQDQPHAGLWPDALIPTRDRLVSQDLNKSFPVDVPAGQNRVAWVDILVPPDAKAGLYHGELEVSADNFNTARIPIDLEVLDFTIPATSSLKSAFGMTWSAPCQALYQKLCDSNDQGFKTSAMFTKLALNNRISIFEQFQPPTSATNYDGFEQHILPMFRSNPPTPPLPGLQLPNAKLTSIKVDIAHLSNWKAWARSKGLTEDFLSRGFVYDRRLPTGEKSCDEPTVSYPDLSQASIDNWNRCKQQAMKVREPEPAPSGWPDISILATGSFQDANDPLIKATPLINILTPLVSQMEDKKRCEAKPPSDPCNKYFSNQRSKYDEFLAISTKNQVWMYTSCETAGCGDTNEQNPYLHGWPGYVIDAPASEARAMGWLSFVYNTAGELYYDTVNKLSTAWTDQLTEGANGDGTLFYPGTPDLTGGKEPIPIESMRLKLIRDGYEDFEYLHWLKMNGKAAQATNVATRLFNNTFSTRRSNSDIQSARKELIDLIKTSGSTCQEQLESIRRLESELAGIRQHRARIIRELSELDRDDVEERARLRRELEALRGREGSLNRILLALKSDYMRRCHPSPLPRPSG